MLYKNGFFDIVAPETTFIKEVYDAKKKPQLRMLSE